MDRNYSAVNTIATDSQIKRMKYLEKEYPLQLKSYLIICESVADLTPAE